MLSSAWTPAVAPGRFTITLPVTKLSRAERAGEGFCCWLKRAAGRKSSPATTTTSTRRKRSHLTGSLQRGFLQPLYIPTDESSAPEVSTSRPQAKRYVEQTQCYLRLHCKAVDSCFLVKLFARLVGELALPPCKATSRFCRWKAWPIRHRCQGASVRRMIFWGGWRVLFWKHHLSRASVHRSQASLTIPCRV